MNRVTVWLHIMRHRSVTYSRDSAFNALADPTRRAVLDLLRAGTRPAGEIARAFPISRPAISKHLKILRRAHLVDASNSDPGRPVVWSHPAFANRCVYARNDKEIVCASLAAGEERARGE